MPSSPAFRRLLVALVTAVATASVGLIPTVAGAAVVAVPASIPSNCSVDVTARIQAWIDSVPNGSTLQFAPGACYRIDGTLAVVARTGLTIDGRGATFRQVTNGSELVNPTKIRVRNVWTFGRDIRLTVRDMTVIGANPHAGRFDAAYQPKFEAQHAFLVQGGDTILLDHVQAYDTYGDFVWVGPGTDRLTVRNSTFARNGRQGWTINGNDILFENNAISETRRATIDMEPTFPTWTAHNVTIRNNTIGRGRLLFLANVGAYRAAIDGVYILDNHLVGKAMDIMVAGSPGMRTNYHIVGNTSDARVSGSGGVMYFYNVNGLEVRDNVQPTQAGHHLVGLGLKQTSHAAISGNRWPFGKGVWVDRGGNVDIRQWGNTIGNPLAVSPATTTLGPTVATPH